MIYIGVDPGSKSGAYAVINDRLYTVQPWDDTQFIKDMRLVAGSGDKAVALVEKVGAMPKQGVRSTWNFGKNAGYIEGALHALSIPFQLVPPGIWKKEFSLNSDKAKSIGVCHRLFPDVILKRTDKSRVDDNNLAEALLMAEYARRKF